jgi:hypothetical protein
MAKVRPFKRKPQQAVTLIDEAQQICDYIGRETNTNVWLTLLRNSDGQYHAEIWWSATIHATHTVTGGSFGESFSEALENQLAELSEIVGGTRATRARVERLTSWIAEQAAEERARLPHMTIAEAAELGVRAAKAARR